MGNRVLRVAMIGLLTLGGVAQAAAPVSGEFHSLQDVQGIQNGKLGVKTETTFEKSVYRQGDSLTSQRVQINARPAERWSLLLGSEMPISHDVPENSSGVRFLDPGINDLTLGATYEMTEFNLGKETIPLGAYSRFVVPTAKNRSPRNEAGLPSKVDLGLSVSQQFGAWRFAGNAGAHQVFADTTHVSGLLGAGGYRRVFNKTWLGVEASGNSFDGTEVSGLIRTDPLDWLSWGDLVLNTGYSRDVTESNRYSVFMGLELRFPVPEVGKRSVRFYRDDLTVISSSVRRANREDPYEKYALSNYPLKYDYRLYFEYKSFNLAPESKPFIQEVSKITESRPDIKIRVRGFSDRIGSEAYNKKLSMKRAESVKDAIQRATQLDDSSFILEPIGNAYPTADNGLTLGRAMNRRVEISFVDAKGDAHE